MAEWSVEGSWVGEYRFDSDRVDAIHATAFTLHLSPGWFGRFRGTVQDDPATGMPDPGLLKGKVRGNSVRFWKLMPVAYHFELGPDQRGDPSKMLRSSGAHPPILYEGVYDSDKGVMTGTWHMPHGTLVDALGRSRRSLPLTGTWSASRRGER
jgi:hypothetical protein